MKVSITSFDVPLGRKTIFCARKTGSEKTRRPTCLTGCLLTQPLRVLLHTSLKVGRSGKVRSRSMFLQFESKTPVITGVAFAAFDQRYDALQICCGGLIVDIRFTPLEHKPSITSAFNSKDWFDAQPESIAESQNGHKIETCGALRPER